MLRFATLGLFVFASACTPRQIASPVSPNDSTEPVSVPGVPAAVADASAVLNGTVTYADRIDLPPGAVVRVRVEDVSVADAPATVVAEHEFQATQQVPFALAYNPARVDVGHRYAVRAEIRDASGQLLWTTTTDTPVFTRGAPIDGVEVVVEAVRD